MDKAFYVDLVRDSESTLTFAAGPFVSEAAARKYEIAAFKKAIALADGPQWWLAGFDRYGVIGIPIEDAAKLKGKFNDMLDIDPADLLVVS